MPPFLGDVLDPANLGAFTLVSARLGGLFSIAPLWSMSGVPRTLRAALTIVFAMLLLPACPPVAMPEQPLAFALPLVFELVIGIAIGLAAALIVQGATLGGEVAAVQMGLALGPQIAPMPEVPVSGVAQVHAWLALLVYVTLGGHLVLLRGLADSLGALPPGQALDLGGGLAVVRAAGELFTVALRTAAPVLVAVLLTQVALAVLNRAVPQLNAMMVSFPVTLAVGFLITGLSTAAVGHALAGRMDGLGGDLDHLLGALGASLGR